MYTNSAFLGKHIYNYNQSDNIIFISNYNPLSFKNNINKISTNLTTNNPKTPQWLDFGTITNVYTFITYAISKDDSINFKGNIIADKIYLLFKLNNNEYYCLEQLNKPEICAINPGFKLNGVRCKSSELKYMNIPIDIPCSRVNLKYDDSSCYGYAGYKCEIKTKVPFFNQNFMNKINEFFNKKYFFKHKEYIPDLLSPNKEIVLNTEDIALQEAEYSLRNKFNDLNSDQEYFLSNFKSVERNSKFYIL